MKQIVTLATLLATTASFAEETALVGHSFHFEGTNLSTSGVLDFSSYKETSDFHVTERIIELHGGDVSHQRCDGGLCYAYVSRDFLKTELWATVEETQVLKNRSEIEALAGVIHITISEETGGSFFPLEDGKTLTWKESWKGDTFQAEYDLTLTQSCCQTSPTSASLSDELWQLEYTFNDTSGEDFSHGKWVLLFDPKLNWPVAVRSVGTNRVSGLNAVFVHARDLKLKAITKP